MKTDTLDLRLMDCMDLMRDTPDGFYDLAVVDPPYGIKCDNFGVGGSKPHLRTANKSKKNWDAERPSIEYFKELRRVAKEQIIWGGNHFADMLGPSAGIIFWDKIMIDGLTLGDGELAWNSIGGRLSKFSHQWCGYLRESEREAGKRIHPTQKPVALYRWIFANYAKPGMRVLDTHLGSCSSAIAAHYSGMHLTGCELDPDYYAAGIARVKREIAQTELFQPAEIHPAMEQTTFRPTEW
jgi:site-specific DNA-methyltransferase (adenine-specific)